MPSTVELNDDQFQKLLDEYYAPPKQRTKLTVSEIQEIARLLNKKINIPIVNETREEKILIKIVLKVDGFLYDNLPNEIYDLLRTLDQGIDGSEAKRLIIRLSKLANDYIDIPYMPETEEYIAIKYIIELIINAARKYWDFDKAKNATSEELEAVLLED